MKKPSLPMNLRLFWTSIAIACLVGCAGSARLPQSAGQVSPFDRIKTAQLVLAVPDALPTKITRFSTKREPVSITSSDRFYAQQHSSPLLKSFVQDVSGRFLALANSQQVPLQRPTPGLPTLRLQPLRIETICSEQHCSTYLYVRTEAFSMAGQPVWSVESSISSERRPNEPDFDTFASRLFGAMKRDSLWTQ